jgi:NodT family efflux transporter outer membrane factor (OMF) lipoprotein
MNAREATSRLAPSLLALVAPAALAALAGCMAVGPDYQTPETEMPAGWRESDARFAANPAAGETQSGGVAPAGLDEWWHRLNDPLLDELIARTARQGLDLREALSRIREARALRGVAGADRFPTLDAVGSYRRSGESDNTPLGGFVPDNGVFTVGFDATWEIDLWGRVRRQVEAADADLAATYEDARDVAVTVAAETALRYVDLRSFQRRLAIARQNVDLQEQTLAVVRGRFESGMVGARDVAQASTVVESTRARVPALEAGVRIMENRLAVLAGLAPGALADELKEVRPVPVPPLEIVVGMPADLLRRRPDVRRAERVLAAETARIGVAKGDLYPRLALNGTLGLASEDIADLLKRSSNYFSFGPSLRWNIFDAGRIRELAEAQDARAEQAHLRWERTVLVALEECEDAMTAFVREQVRRASLLEAATQARLAVDLAQTQYTNGLTDFQTVLDSEREVASLEDDLADSDSAVTTHVIRIYKSLGGGWPASRAGEPAAKE